MVTMISGRKTLNNIDQSLRTVRNEAVRLDQQLSQLVGQLTLSQRHRLTLLKDIAKIRLNEIDSGELQVEFDAADSQVQGILEKRERAVADLAILIEDLNADIEQGEINREAMLAECNSVSDQIVQIEAAVQTNLASNQDYLDQYQVSQHAESVSEEAELKVEQAQADMAEKIKPYHIDPLFMYLWQRGFGTTTYKAGLFSRYMDQWVARLIDYEPARINFWNLTEIPKRLTEHADRVAEAADQAMSELQDIEAQALAAAGVSKLEVELEALRATLDAHDDNTEIKESELNDALSQRAAFNSGSDDFMQQCLNRITSALEHKNLTSIHRYVAQTHSPMDDSLVIELQELEDSLTSLQGDMQGVRKLHDGQIAKLRALENVRQQFKNSRFDDVRSGFANEALIASVLTQFLQGVVSGADLWGTIKRNQRYRNVGSAPDFGSGGLGDLADVLRDSGVDIGNMGGVRRPRRRRSRSSSWHIPKPRAGSGGFFETGGGF